MLKLFSRHPLLFALLAGATASAASAADNLRLAISGGNPTLRNNVRHHLDLGRLPCTIGELQLGTALAGADEAISAALRALGHYHGSWTLSHERVPGRTGNDDCWRVAVHLEPGPPTLLTRVAISLTGNTGDNDGDLLAVIPGLPLKEGTVVNHGHYEDSKRQLRQRALAVGYFSSTLTHSVLAVDALNHSASAELVLDTGPRYRFGAVNYGDTGFDQDFLARYQTFASGDYYDTGKLIAFQNNLINSQYFSTVSVDQGEPDPDSTTVDLNLELVPKTRYESIVGAGYSTDIGPRVSYRLHDRRFNSRGDTYQLSSQYAPVQSNLGFQFQQPGRDPVKEKTLWLLGIQDEDTDSAESTSYKAEVAVVNVLDNGWVQTHSLTLLNEKFRVADDTNTSLLLYPGIGWTRSRANDPRYPTRGWRLGASVKGGLEDLLSNTSFAQATTDAKIILPLGGGRLIGRSGLGTTAVRDFARLPASLRFFAGGDNSVRGFAYESLGPRDGDDKVVGGKHQITASVEYDRLVYRDFGLAAFYDTGTAFDTNQFTLYESVGLGVRWFSPIGPIRVDLAFPLDDGGFRVHLSMGPDL